MSWITRVVIMSDCHGMVSDCHGVEGSDKDKVVRVQGPQQRQPT